MQVIKTINSKLFFILEKSEFHFSPENYIVYLMKCNFYLMPQYLKLDSIKVWEKLNSGRAYTYHYAKPI